MSETYTLEFPIIIPSTMEVSFDEISREESSLKFTLSKLKKADSYYLKIEGFREELVAIKFINNINAGLLWMTICNGLPSTTFTEPQKFKYSDDAEKAAKNLNKKMNTNYSRVDALVNWNMPVVYKCGKQIVKIILHTPTIKAPFPGEKVFDDIMKGISFQHSDKIVRNEKLKLAIELYAAYSTENSDNARFITLMMAFEALAESKKRPKYLQSLVRNCEKELNDLAEKNMDDNEKDTEIKSFRGSLNHLKEDSLKTQLHDLVLSTLQYNSDDDAKEKADMIKKIYDNRSELVHKGYIEPLVIKKEIRKTKKLLEQILRIKFLHIAGSSY